MNVRIAVLVVGAFLLPAVAQAAECSAAPVRSAEQAACYASVYAEKNKLPHTRPLTRQVAKGMKVWTVRFADKRRDTRGAGWEVDVDVASGMITRFMGYKERQP